MTADQKARNLCIDFWQPLGGFEFPLGYPLLVHRNRHTREENSANPKLALRGRRCSLAAACLGFGLHTPPPLAPPGENPPFNEARFGYLVRKLAP